MQAITLILILFAVTAVIYAQPPNTSCESAIDLNFEVPTGGATIAVDISEMESGVPQFGCALTPPSSEFAVWYTFNSGDNNFLIASFCEVNPIFMGDPSLYLLSGTCDTQTCVTSDDNTCSLNNVAPEIETTITQNTQYYLVVATTLQGAHQFYFELSQTTDSTNDRCSNAIPLQLGIENIIATELATIDVNFINPCTLFPGGETTPVGWFSFNSGSNNVVEFSFCGLNEQTPLNVDPVIFLLSGTCESNTCIAGNNDDTCGTLPQMRTAIQSNTDYLLAIGSYQSINAPFTLRFSFNLESELINDLCANRQPINSTTVSGSLTGASPDALICETGDFTAGTVFYSFNSGPNNLLLLGDCLFDNGTFTISLFSGSCDALSCQLFTPDFCGVSGSTEISLIQFTDYILTVTGVPGDFSFSFNLSFDLTNDDCLFAIPITRNLLFSGDITSATPDSLTPCNTSIVPSANIWYSFTTSETDRFVLISTCSVYSGTNGFDTLISLLSGSCDVLTCITSNDNTCGTGSELYSEVLPNTQYFIEVSGSNGEIGAFTFYFNLFALSDLCEFAPIITPGIISGTTIGTTFTSIPSITTCGIPISEDNTDIWYQFNSGISNNLTISSCDPSVIGQTVFDIQFFLFTGTCNQLICITGIDNSDGCATDATLTTEINPNTDYFLLISGSTQGIFSFLFSLSTTSSNNCNNAEIIAQRSVLVPGSLASGATFSLAPCELISPGFSVVWYEFYSGLFTEISISTCQSDGGSANFNTALYLFSGECNSFSCVATNDDFEGCGLASKIVTTIMPNTTYRIAVDTNDQTLGEFSLQFDLSLAVENEFCFNATLIETNFTGIIEGTNLVLSSPAIGSCPNAQFSNVWYKFNSGDNNLVEISFCSQNGTHHLFATVVNLYSGTNCESLACVTSDINGCGEGGSNLSTTISAFTDYYISIGGVSETDIGTFGFGFSLQKTLAGDDCETQIVTLNPLPSQILTGSTNGATFDIPGFCGSLLISGSNVWYTFNSLQYDSINISSCNGVQNSFNIAIALATGSCSTPGCVINNLIGSPCIDILQILTPQTQYILQISGATELDFGDFNLFLQFLNTNSTSNDLCEFAPEVISGQSYSGSVTMATFDGITNPCSGLNTTETANVWYFFDSGISNHVVIDMCPNENETSLFTGTIQLFQMNSCTDLNQICIDFAESSSCPRIESEIVTNQRFYIAISADQGDFTFSFTLSTNTTSNNTCSSPSSLTRRSLTSISLDEHTPTALLTSCGIQQNIYAFYGFNSGSDDFIIVTTCSNLGGTINFSGIIYLYHGNCSQLTCDSVSTGSCDAGAPELSGTLLTPNTDYILAFASISAEQPTGGLITFYFDTSNNNTSLNDMCINAATLTSGALYNGTTLDAINHDTFIACGDHISDSPTLWYTFNSGPNSVAFITLCNNGATSNFPTEIAIYSGICGGLTCIEGNSNNENCTLGGSELLLNVLPNTNYYLIVSGASGQSGNFSFYFELSMVVNNDNCESGTLLPSSGELLVSGSLLASTNDMLFNLTNTICDGFGSYNETGNVWYSFNSDNHNFLLIELCGDGIVVNFPIVVSIYEGTCNAPIMCVAAVQSCVPFRQLISPFTNYMISVTSTTSSIGDFAFRFALELATSNDQCTSPIELISGSLVDGTTHGALFDSLVTDSICNVDGTANIWYKFNSGNNNKVILSTCEADMGFALYNITIQLFSGSCDGLTCITFANRNCDLTAAKLQSSIQQNNDYYVAISGTGGITGAFRLYFELLTVSENDECINAEDIIGSNTVIIGSTTNSTFDGAIANCLVDIGNDTIETTGNVWYRFNSLSFDQLSVSTCVPTNATFDIVVSLFSGDCNSIVCISSALRPCLSLNTGLIATLTQNTEYLLSIGSLTGSGDFQFEFILSNFQTNDLCSQAQVITQTQGFIGGTTVGSTLDLLNTPCAFTGNVPTSDVWYQFFSGSFNHLFISTCQDTAEINFSSTISLYTEGCASATCVSFDSTSCGISPLIDINIQEQTTYFIAVSGILDETGIFSFYFELSQNLTNDQCSGATILTSGVSVNGSTEFATPETGLQTCLSLTIHTGVWYTFNSGNNTRASISSCGSSFDTTLFVFSGLCESLICEMEGNDNTFCATSASIIMNVTENTNYFVLLAGVNADSKGEFTLLLTLSVITPPNNTICANATSLVSGQTVLGSTFDAILDDSFPVDFRCQNFGPLLAGSVWYSFNSGTFDRVLLSLCDSLDSNFTLIGDPTIFLFEGTCSNNNCLSSSDDNCGVAPMIERSITPGTDYLVAVSQVGQDYTEFQLYFELNTAPLNDECINAIVLTNNTLVSGTTLFANLDVTLSDCFSIQEGNNVWYEFHSGNATHLLASLCSTSGGFANTATSLFLYQKLDENCLESSLLCVTGVSDECPEINLDISPDTDYYITVAGSPLGGDFALQFAIDSAPLNDDCPSAIEITSNSTIITGTTSFASFDPNFPLGSCTLFARSLLFYRFNSSTYNYLTVSTCLNNSTLSEPETFLLFTGGCDTPVCDDLFAFNFCSDNTEQQTFLQLNTEYVLVVASNMTSEFSFLFSLSNANLTSNNDCQNAELVNATTGLISGSNIFAGLDDTFLCDSLPHPSATVWYHFNSGLNNFVTISFCHPESLSSFNTAVALYQASNCSEIQSCLLSNDDSCGNQAEFQSEVMLNTEYFFTISGSNAERGNFTFYFELNATLPLILIAPIPDTFEGSVVHLSATYSIFDVISGTIDWGDGSTPTSIDISTATKLLNGTHVYADDGNYTITLDVTTTLGSGEYVSEVTILNAAPFFPNNVSFTALDGRIITFQPFTFIEPGTLDNITSVTIDYGDGTVTVITPNYTPFGPPGSESGNLISVLIPAHVYGSAGIFSAVISVTDDDGATGNFTFGINSDPALIYYVPYRISWKSTTTDQSELVDVVLSDGVTEVIQNVHPIPETLEETSFSPVGFNPNRDLTLSVRRRTDNLVLVSVQVRLLPPEFWRGN